VGIDALLAEFIGKIFIMVAQELRIGGIVKGYHDGVLFYAKVALKAFKEITG